MPPILPSAVQQGRIHAAAECLPVECVAEFLRLTSIYPASTINYDRDARWASIDNQYFKITFSSKPV